MRWILVGVIVFSWVFGGASFDVGAVEKSLVRVKLMIQADEESQTVVANLLRKELRALGDISLVNEKPDYEIRVIVMGSAAKDKENSGVAFSTVFLNPYVRSGIPNFYLNRCKIDKEDLQITEDLERTQIYKDHLLQVGSGKDIEQICKDIAQNFKGNLLGPPRLSLQNR
ncbi:MAG: hypothetical protein H6Q42_2509 [Deltaproteobacteria bacterium]|nr:hypothetical protein [Deltaproteobacteria bacterium]